MFGVVPRAIWKSWTPVLENHTVPLATTPFLVEDGLNKILIEPGLGARWSDKQVKMFSMDFSDGKDLLISLKEIGVQPEEITHCLMSHCHWDHVGAACGADGKPVFPNAIHWTPKVEAENCQDSSHFRRASYRLEDIQPLQEAGLLQTFEGFTEVLPGISMHQLGGHSDGASVIVFHDKEADAKACFWGDVVPTRNHVHLPVIMAYDMNAERSFEVRKQWIPLASKEDWVCLLFHDPISPIGFIVESEKGFSWKPIVE